MEGVDSDTHVELVLATVFHHVLVGTDTSGLQCLARQLLILVRNKMDTEWKLVYWGFLCTQVIDPDLRI